MTEDQIRSVSPELLSQDLSTNLVETDADSTTKRLPVGLVFAGFALLMGAIIYLKSDQKTPPKPAAPRKKTKSRKKS